MKKNQFVMLSGIILVVIAVALISIYELIEELNSSEYTLSRAIIEPGKHNVGNAVLKGENEISIRISVKQIGTPIQVTVTDQEGKLVGEFTSDKKHDYKIVENPYPKGNYEIITSNLGEEPTDVFVSVKDVKQPGTYIETYDAWWILTPAAGIFGVIGVFTLLLGIGMFFANRKNDKTKNKIPD